MLKIGIVPAIRLDKDLNWYTAEYFIPESYVSQIRKAGGLPVGLLCEKGKAFKEQLELCDAFLMIGGQRIMPYHMQVIDHCYKSEKKLLGICLGMQAVHSYFIVQEEMKKRGSYDDYLSFYERMKQERYFFVEPIEGHARGLDTSYEEENLRPVIVKSDSNLSTYLPKECMTASRHRYRITKPAACLKISAFDPADFTIEGLEMGENILCVQFHPELTDDFSSLFRFLTT